MSSRADVLGVLALLCRACRRVGQRGDGESELLTADDIAQFVADHVGHKLECKMVLQSGALAFGVFTPAAAGGDGTAKP